MFVIGIESKISDGTVTRFETNEHCMINELTVVPIGVNVDNNDWLVTVWAAGKVPDAKPIIVPMLPDVGIINCGV